MTQSGSNPNNNNQQPSAQQPPAANQNQQVPAKQGNPRFQNPGMDPSPNPKVVVKAVNPPVTPDQVVGLAEIPAAATIDLPKIQNIKIPPVKNKTVQGHLKAIEGKMIATEKLMKNIVKLQKLQIHTEKELFERKRELYQNTFEEYLLDKTIDFEDPEDPNCTCINLPKKPPGGGGFLLGGGKKKKSKTRTQQPVQTPQTQRNRQGQNQNSPSRTKPGEKPVVPVPLQPVVPPDPRENEEERNAPPIEIDPSREQEEQETAIPETPLIEKPKPFQLPEIPELTEEQVSLAEEGRKGKAEKYIPAFLGPYYQSLSDFFYKSKELRANGTPASEAPLTGGLNTPDGGFLTVRPVGPPWNRRPEFSYKDGITWNQTKKNTQQFAKTMALVQAVMNVLGPVAGAYANRPGMTTTGQQQTTKIKGNKPVVPPKVQGENNIVPGRIRAPIGNQSSIKKSLTPKSELTNVAANKQAGESVLANILSGKSPFDVGQTKAVTNLVDKNYQSLMSRKSTAFDGDFTKVTMNNSGAGSRDFLTSWKSLLQGSSLEQAGGVSMPIKKIMRSLSKDPIASQKFDKDYQGPSITKNASGAIDGTELYNSSALNYFRNVSDNIKPMGEGGLIGWWNKGRNMRVPNESNAPWRGSQGLLADDAKQLTRTNKAFKSGAGGIKGWRPLRAFTPEMVRTGPTPAVRQAFERPVRAASHPLMLLAELIINELVNPAPTAIYDQVTGPNAFNKDPRFKRLENAQDTTMSGNTSDKPEIVPLPPDYIKIPGKEKTPNFVGEESPDIDMKPSIFTRPNSHTD